MSVGGLFYIPVLIADIWLYGSHLRLTIFSPPGLFRYAAPDHSPRLTISSSAASGSSPQFLSVNFP